MKPHVIMLKLTPMTARETQIAEPFKCQKVELEDLVFLRMPTEVEVALKMDTNKRDFVTQLGQAATQSGKTFVLLPEGTEVLRIEERWEPLTDEC